jgi:hypothetical protein
MRRSRSLLLGKLEGFLGHSPTPNEDGMLPQQPTMSEIFTTIYQTNAWQNAESRSGPGSTVARCQAVIQALTDLVGAFAVKSLLDAPCGDFNWMKEVPLPDTAYIGVDVVPEVIDRNQRLYGNSWREFRCLDITRGPLPRVDMIFCRDGLVHLCEADVLKALAVFKRSDSRYLAATTFPARTSNEDITTGEWRPVNLEKAPFHLPAPLRLVSDGCLIPGYTDKALGVWRLEQVQA